MPSDTALPSPDTRQRLLQATERLVYAGGIHATGMDLIVRTSGVARKQVYRLYSNKDALVAAALRARDERWMQWFVAASSRAQALAPGCWRCSTPCGNGSAPTIFVAALS